MASILSSRSTCKNDDKFKLFNLLIFNFRRDTPKDVYAPQYFLENEDMFESLLVPPGDRV